MLIIAHRGASGHLPENTLAAFKKAHVLKADMIAFDVRRAKSGEVVVINDAKVDRTTNGKGYVKNKTLAEIKVLNAGNGEKIPTLEEALDSIGKETKIIITIKEASVIEPTAQVLMHYIINKHWNPENFLVASTKFFKLQKVKEQYSFFRIAPVIVFFPKIFTHLLSSLQPYSLLVDKKFISKSFLAYAKSRHISVFVWTVNDRQTIEKMKELHVDGIITDFPDKVRELLK